MSFTYSPTNPGATGLATYLAKLLGNVGGPSGFLPPAPTGTDAFLVSTADGILGGIANAGATFNQFTEISAFTNSWANFGSTAGEKAAYTKTAAGVVHVKGVIAAGTVGLAAFTLPAGYRPIGRRQFAANTGGNVFGVVEINPSGAVIPQTPTNNTYVFLDCSFIAEQ